MLRQLDRDCEFLEAEGIMDYSLLIGLHFRNDHSADGMKSSGKRDLHDDEMHLCRYALFSLLLVFEVPACCKCAINHFKIVLNLLAFFIHYSLENIFEDLEIFLRFY